jgi:hypothetical protein
VNTRARVLWPLIVLFTAGSVVYLVWQGRPVSAIAYAINGTTFAILYLAFVLESRGRL